MSFACHFYWHPNVLLVCRGKSRGLTPSTFPKTITMLSLRRTFPCCRGLHVCGFPRRPPTARTRLPPTPSHSSHQILTAQRLNADFSRHSRTVSTTPSTSCDAVGKIQSTHYHLVYTCKVPLFERSTDTVVVSCQENVDRTFFSVALCI